MDKHYKKEGKYSYYEAGEGTPIVILHGLMGGLSNFDAVAEYFPTKGYKVCHPGFANIHSKHFKNQCKKLCEIRKRLHHF
jgi:esterase/lipase